MGIICIRRLAPTIKDLELNLKFNQSHYEESNDYKQDEHQELSPRGDWFRKFEFQLLSKAASYHD